MYFATIDYLRVNYAFKTPIFCICTMMMKDGGSGTYVGLGYSFDIKGNFIPEEWELKGVTKYDYYILGIKVKSVVRN